MFSLQHVEEINHKMIQMGNLLNIIEDIPDVGVADLLLSLSKQVALLCTDLREEAHYLAYQGREISQTIVDALRDEQPR